MISTVHTARHEQEPIGYRYTRWCLDVEPSLTAAQKASAYDVFADLFGALPPHLQPYDGWGESLAYLCRRIACRHRGEPVGDWVPRWERVRRAGEARLRQVS